MDIVSDLRAEISRLKVIIDDQRETIKRLSGEVKTHEAKEQSISSAILFAVERGSQWDSSVRKIYELDIQRSRLLYARLERVLNELYVKYPELKKENKLKEMTEKFKTLAYNSDLPNRGADEVKNVTSEDPIRKLLNNIISYIGEEKTTKTLTRNRGVSSALDAINSEYSKTPSSSGFNINEALNPTEDLEDILKSFNLKRKN